MDAPDVGLGAATEAMDSALDFLSEDFDPERALATPGLQPPDPAAQPLDNVAKCRSILPAEHPEALCNITKKTASEASKLKASSFKDRASRLTQRIQDSCHISLQRVASCVKPGPVRVLDQWMQQGLRVRVVTRHARGVRGTATGLLTAYDRFMNVVLKDVEEHYTVRMRVLKALKQQAPAPAASEKGGPQQAAAGSGPCVSSSTPEEAFPASTAVGAKSSSMASVVFRPNPTSADDDPVEPGELGIVAVPVGEKTRWVHRQDHRQRRLAQIFIKGDSIVMISPEQQLSRVQPAVQPPAVQRSAVQPPTAQPPEAAQPPAGR